MACETLESESWVGARFNLSIEDHDMARKGTAFFDNRGNFFKTAEDATISDLAHMLGQSGEGESLARGIAQNLLEQRETVLRLFAEYEQIREDSKQAGPKPASVGGNVAALAQRRR